MRRRLLRLVGVVAGLVILYALVMAFWVWRAESWEATEGADVALVMGAAQYNGTPSPVFSARLDHALELYRQRRVAKVVVTGGRQAGDTFTEGYAGLRYLLSKGIPEADLVVVSDGSSTWESVAAAARVIRSNGWTTAIVVTDPYHAFRARGIADEAGIDSQVSSTATASSFGQFGREWVIVMPSELVGYGRVHRLIGG